MRGIRGTGIVLLLATLAGAATAQQEQRRGRAGAARPDVARDTRARIANALTAAPTEITAQAAVMDWPAREGAGFSTLREGSNGWTCVPDDPSTRGNDPQCMDAEWLAFMEAAVAGRTPTVRRVGYSYMLSTDAEGSNTDLAARSATADNQWHRVGPHLMVIYPEARMLDGLPTEPRAGEPYVMYAGTPFAHVMWPAHTGAARRGTRAH